MQTDAEGTGTWSIHDDMAHTTPECARQELLPGSVGYVSVDSHSIAELKPQTYSPVSHMETQTPPGLDPSAQGAFDWKAKATELEAALHEAQETLAEQMGAAERVLESKSLCNDSTYVPLNASSGVSETGLYEDYEAGSEACFEEDVSLLAGGGRNVSFGAVPDSTHLTEVVAMTDVACATEDSGPQMPEPVQCVDTGSDAVNFEGAKMRETGSDAATLHCVETVETASDAVAFEGPVKIDAGCLTDFVQIPDNISMATNSTQTRTEMGDSTTQTRIDVAVQGSQTRTEVGVCATQTLVEISHAASATDAKVTSHAGVQTYPEFVEAPAEGIKENDEPASEDVFLEEESDSESSVCSIPVFEDPLRAKTQALAESKASLSANLEPLTLGAVAGPPDTMPAAQHCGAQRSCVHCSHGAPAALSVPAPTSQASWDGVREVDMREPQPWAAWLSPELPAHPLPQPKQVPPGGPVPPMDPCLARSQLIVRSAELERLKTESVHRQCLQASNLRAPVSVQSFVAEIRSVMIA